MSAAIAEQDRDGAIRQVSATYADSRRRVLIANSDGLLVEDDRVRTRFGVQCVAVGDTGMQTGFEAPGRTVGFELFDEIPPEDVARTAARRALTMLRARPAPSGKLPVVLKRGAGGVLFHEACGHGLEADLVDKDASVFRGKVGQRVASPVLTLVDDGTYAREWGTFAVDDEGAPGLVTADQVGEAPRLFVQDLLEDHRNAPRGGAALHRPLERARGVTSGPDLARPAAARDHPQT
jgi:TldD protein